MTISSSLNAGVAGLSTNATRLATISDNIANSSTYGYKRAVADFQSMVTASGPGSYSAGGVRATTQRIIDKPGSLVSSTNPTDLAINGRGFLPVTTIAAVNANAGQPPLLLTTTASFRPDAAGYLTASNGLVLMGWPANADGTMPTYPRDSQVGLRPVQINSTGLVGEPTTQMGLQVNLPATATVAGAVGNPEVLTTIEYFDNLGVSQSLSIEFLPDVPVTGASNAWQMQIRDGAANNAIIGNFELTFDPTRGQGGSLQSVNSVIGAAYDPVAGTIGVDVAGGPITINIGTIGSPVGMTQLSNTFIPGTVTKNGSPVGNLVNVEVDAQGNVNANYDVGVSKRLYQVPLVDVPNINGLMSMDSQAYQITAASGNYYLWNSGEGPTGQVAGYSREESTADVAGELTQLIQTQRAYSSNAKVIQTVDEMLQETANIKR